MPSTSVSSLTSAIVRASSSYRVDTRCLTCLVKVTVAFSTNVSSLPPVPRTRNAAWVPVDTYVLLQRSTPKVKHFLPLPRETALASSFTLAFLSTGWMNFTMQLKASDAKHAVILPVQLPSEQRGAISAKSIHSCCVAVSVPTNFCTTDAS